MVMDPAQGLASARVAIPIPVEHAIGKHTNNANRSHPAPQVCITMPVRAPQGCSNPYEMCSSGSAEATVGAGPPSVWLLRMRQLRTLLQFGQTRV